MKKSKFTEAQIVFALRQADTGTVVAEHTSKIGLLALTLHPLYVSIPQRPKGLMVNTG